ncbi:hypothetical protein KSP40_PGU017982 [Platanthera guangdongensis]|uniref:Vacuolar amino acid transporter YPQ1 n=1 Tax=Platanthera guangdongensis TaxID=2320717 RepID=A0ABR2LLH8_9ASPA
MEMGAGSYNKLCGAVAGDDEERRGCVEWVEKYFKDCVCDVGSEMSFGLGIVSLIFWGIAEIPQLLTNFRTKSAHGVSLAFLLTWFIGDIFNLVGCHLEQATLPTQYYTALLYTAVTAVLIVQTFYYGYYARRHPRKGRNVDVTAADDDVEADEKKKPLLDPKSEGEKTNAVGTVVMIRASNIIRASPRSARSLASSGTPSYLQAASCAAFIIGSAGLPSQANSLMETNIYFHGRRLLKNARLMTAMESNPYGIALGWVMAAIYMGGRLPQIYLNIKRGGVEGLNPLMFMFAIIANATYVGSILARSVEWEMIKGNAPWLLDAIICVLLDLFIMMQFAYYRFVFQGRKSSGAEDEGNDKDASSIEGPNKSAIA